YTSMSIPSFVRQSKHGRRPATKAHPCPVCRGDHKCSVGEDGLIFCGRKHGEEFGFVYLGAAKKDPQFGLYRREGDPHLKGSERPQSKPADSEEVDWQARASRLAALLSPKLRRQLAETLGLPEACLSALQVGFAPKGPHQGGGACWTFPEVDAEGNILGI